MTFGSKLNNTERIQLLESDVAKLSQNEETNRESKSMRFDKVMKAITDLSSKVVNLCRKSEKKEEDWDGFDGLNKLGRRSVKIGFGCHEKKTEDGKKDHTTNNNNNRDPLHDCRKINMPVFEGDEWIQRYLDRSLNSVSGLTPFDTMKVKGEVGGIEVVVLIDSGATHNFVSKGVVDKVGMETTGTGCAAVQLGNGTMVPCWGTCKGVVLNLPELQIVEEFIPFDLGGTETDIILGIKWLRTLGDMTVNWSKLRMKFWNADRLITLTGDPSLSKTLVSCKSLCKMLQHEEEGYLNLHGDKPPSPNTWKQLVTPTYHPLSPNTWNFCYNKLNKYHKLRLENNFLSVGNIYPNTKPRGSQWTTIFRRTRFIFGRGVMIYPRGLGKYISKAVQ